MIETHVLLDEAGVPLLRGTEIEMNQQHDACVLMGIDGVKVEPIKLWKWSMINWGD